LGGTDDYASIAHSLDLQPEKITVSAWVKPAATLSSPTYAGFVRKDANDIDTAGYGYILAYTDNKLVFKVGTGSGTYAGAEYVTELTGGQWYHLVGTYDGTDINLYLNGVKVGTGAGGNAIDYGAYTNALTLGSYRSSVLGGTQFYNGLLDEVQLFGYGLTENQVRGLYNKGSAASFN
jgi:hypothetical protein